jgi:hypothetical protein
MKYVFYFMGLILLLACDAKPIDYSKHTRKSSYARASSPQTGQLRKAHARKGVSTSKRAFKNRLNSKSYYNRNRHKKKLRKGD